MKTSFREDVELEDHEHKFELADISIKFRGELENDNFIWPVCENCHEFKRNVSSAEVESWYQES
jgi:hypothetical protein